MKKIAYYDEEFEEREGRVRQRNGNLTYVEDEETGEGQWLAPFEIKEKRYGRTDDRSED